MVHQITKEQFINANIDKVWSFVSSPHNLKLITPEYMNFVIQSNNLPEKMHPGMIISYKVSPILNIRTNWVTEITHVKKNEFFVDEQRVGPYKIWHHQHHLKTHKNGVLMTDIISYRLPFGFLGRIINTLFIKRKLESVFNYRFKAIDRIFNNLESTK